MLYRDYIPNSLLTTMPKQVELNAVSEVQEWTTETAVWSKRRYHLLGGSGGLSTYENNGDKWGCYMDYRGY